MSGRFLKYNPKELLPEAIRVNPSGVLKRVSMVLPLGMIQGIGSFTVVFALIFEGSEDSLVWQDATETIIKMPYRSAFIGVFNLSYFFLTQVN